MPSAMAGWYAWRNEKVFCGHFRWRQAGWLVLFPTNMRRKEREKKKKTGLFIMIIEKRGGPCVVVISSQLLDHRTKIIYLEILTRSSSIFSFFNEFFFCANEITDLYSNLPTSNHHTFPLGLKSIREHRNTLYSNLARKHREKRKKRHPL